MNNVTDTLRQRKPVKSAVVSWFLKLVLENNLVRYKNGSQFNSDVGRNLLSCSRRIVGSGIDWFKEK